MKQYALIVAGGSGSRMGTDIPKQFLLLQNKPVLMHTIEAFYNYNSNIEIILVLPDNQKDYWAKLCSEYPFNTQHNIVSGGITRFQSVKNGLNRITDTDDALVAIHDGVRPLVNKITIDNCFRIAQLKGNAIPFIPLNDSIRKVEGLNSIHVNRDDYKAIQTPQAFHLQLIKNAYSQNYQEHFTDDASVLENIGEAINLVDGNRENIKITTPIDLLFAEAILK